MDAHLEDALPPNGVAVLGMACRFPGADSVEALWQNLCAGHEAITRFSKEELLAAGHDPALVEHPDYVPLNRVLSDVASFDASFFGFTPREAALLDPQQRIFLECAHEALDAAGYGARARRGTVGVFAGVSVSSYLLHNLLPNAELSRKDGLYSLFLHNEKDFLPTRVSYKLDLRGPSVNVQTACSTSLVAVHMACQALLESACDLALAGGASVRVPQETGYLHEKDMIFSRDGRSRAFDARASGTVAGNGVGVVVLKRLDAALADRDPILAIIRGTAINNDGATKVGFTAPSVEGQARVLREALAVAEVSADSISYVEAHGTATALGDPIEVAALTRAFREGTQRRQFCALGALKSNLGHMDAAAGVGGLIKTVLMLQHRKLTPSPSFQSPNPQIDLESSPFYVSTRLSDWPADGSPRRAGVSAFGIGGTNAHVVLEEAPPAPEPSPARAFQLLTLSAKTEGALRAVGERLAQHLERGEVIELADVAHTLHVGREPHALRRAVVCQGTQDALAALRQGDVAPMEVKGARRVVFLFPGGGAQYPRMARDLHREEATFREAFDRCAALARGLVDLDLSRLLFDEADANAHAERMRRPLCGLLCLFAVEYALGELLLSWGITPQAMIGHSVSEYVAACLSGVFSLEDAVRLVARRGQLFETLPPDGAMLSVPLGERELGPMLGERLAIAAVNTPSACTVAGARADLDRLSARLARQGISCRLLHIDVAAHSPVIEPILAPFRETLKTIALSPPRIPIVSNRSGTWMTDEQATDPEHWVQHLRHTVRFADGLATLLAEPELILLEVGPGHTMSSLARQHPAYRGQPAFSTLRHPLVEQPDVPFLLTAVGGLWSCGGHVDWSGFHAREERRRVPLPTYPFERRRFWIDPPAPGQRAPGGAAAAQRSAGVADWFHVPGWKRSAPLASEGSAKLRVVVLAGEETVCSALAAALRGAGHEVVVVRRGAGFARTGPAELTLDPRRPEDHDALCQALAGGSSDAGAPDVIVHAFSVGPAEGGGATTPESVATAQSLGLYSLLFLTQALDRRGWLDRTRVTALMSGVLSVAGEDVSCPERATLLGWLRTAPIEFPGSSCRAVELAVPARAAELDALSRELCVELASRADEPLVAYRGRQRWVPTHERIRLAGVEPEALRRGVRRNGVYLITGGLGGVGLALAAALAERAQARLVLLGRKALPPRPSWERLVEDEGADTTLRDTIRRVLHLERLGAEVLTLAADVCDRQVMAAAIAEARARFGAIHGVIHAAGSPGGGVMLRHTPESVAPTLSPKIEGALVLSELFAEARLDFLVLCSALVTSVGAFGSFDYTAANAFLDAFAHARAGRGGTRVVSIDWNRWRSIGMAKAVEAMHEAVTGETLHGMTEADGREAFLRILGSGALERAAVPQVLVSDEAIESLVRAQSRPDLAQGAPKAAAPARVASHRRPALGTPFVSPGTSTEQRLAALFQELLGIDAVGIHDGFFELGGDSLVGTRLVARMREVFSLELSLRDLFTLPTVAGLSSRIDAAIALRALRAAPAASSGAPEEDVDVGVI